MYKVGRGCERGLEQGVGAVGQGVGAVGLTVSTMPAEMSARISRKKPMPMRMVMLMGLLNLVVSGTMTMS